MKKKIIIDISKQRLKAYLGDEVVLDFPCVSGDAEHETRKGKFSVLQKERQRKSWTYKVPMNYALRLNNNGIFIHEGYNSTANPSNQSFLEKAVSDTATTSVSRVRSWFPSVSKAKLEMKGVNLVGSHGCIRLGHFDAVELFDWADVGTKVEIK